eukprot:3014719-Prymnesium_polylepis.2
MRTAISSRIMPRRLEPPLATTFEVEPAEPLRDTAALPARRPATATAPDLRRDRPRASQLQGPLRHGRHRRGELQARDRPVQPVGGRDRHRLARPADVHQAEQVRRGLHQGARARARSFSPLIACPSSPHLSARDDAGALALPPLPGALRHESARRPLSRRGGLCVCRHAALVQEAEDAIGAARTCARAHRLARCRQSCCSGQRFR